MPSLPGGARRWGWCRPGERTARPQTTCGLLRPRSHTGHAVAVCGPGVAQRMQSLRGETLPPCKEFQDDHPSGGQPRIARPAGRHPVGPHREQTPANAHAFVFRKIFEIAAVETPRWRAACSGERPYVATSSRASAARARIAERDLRRPPCLSSSTDACCRLLTRQVKEGLPAVDWTSQSSPDIGTPTSPFHWPSSPPCITVVAGSYLSAFSTASPFFTWTVRISGKSSTMRMVAWYGANEHRSGPRHSEFSKEIWD